MTHVISVFGANSPAPGSADYEVARDLGRRLAKLGMIVQTGGYGGVMEGASRGACEAGGHVIGVTCARFDPIRPQGASQWVKEEIKQPTLRERVLYLVEMCDGIVVMPGGIGTLSELALAWSFLQAGEIRPKPLIPVGGLWQRTLAAFVESAYVHPQYEALLTPARTPVEAAHILEMLLVGSIVP